MNGYTSIIELSMVYTKNDNNRATYKLKVRNETFECHNIVTPHASLGKLFYSEMMLGKMNCDAD